MKYALVIFLLLPTIIFGQTNFFSIGIDYAFPSSTLKSTAGTGIGLSIRYEHPLTNHLAVIGTIGYLSFASKSITSTQPQITINNKVSMVPIQAGAKYFLFADNKIQKGLFVSGEIGVHILFTKATNNGVELGIPNESDFSYAPGLGYRFGNIEFDYRQQFVTGSGNSINFSNFRIAYVFQRR